MDDSGVKVWDGVDDSGVKVWDNEFVVIQPSPIAWSIAGAVISLRAG